MASDDIATGSNARVDDDDFVIDPSKMKRKSDIPSMAPPPVMTPPPAMTTPPSFAPPPPAQVSFQQPAMSMPSSGTTTNTNSTQTTVNTADLAALAGNSQPSVIEEHWAKSFWRPAMGWLYMIICFMDFVGFPLLTIFLPIIFKPFGLVMPYQAWTSLTLSNGGLIHLAFGAILGVSAFSRGQEKIANK
jgi:hypothetical protein